jgi:uncharacterized protein YcbK (DUF882 family)
MSMRLPRRGLLQAMSGVAATLAIPGAAVAARSPGPEKILSFYHLHTRKKGKFRFWRGDDHDYAGLAEIDYLLRDFRTGEIERIDHRLLHLLHALRSDFDSNGRFEVISGYRSPKTNAELIVKGRGVSAGSLHMVGMAIDVRLPGRDTVLLRRIARLRRAGGVGYYPKYNFVHLDTGRVRHWVSWPRRT